MPRKCVYRCTGIEPVDHDMLRQIADDCEKSVYALMRTMILRAIDDYCIAMQLPIPDRTWTTSA